MSKLADTQRRVAIIGHSSSTLAHAITTEAAHRGGAVIALLDATPIRENYPSRQSWRQAVRAHEQENGDD